MSLIVTARNTSGLAPVSDYEYKVLVGDGTLVGSRVITEGNVRGHTRSDGWKKLIQRILDESEGVTPVARACGVAAEYLRALKADLEMLPSLVVTFGGQPVDPPPCLVRYKVLAVLDTYIAKAEAYNHVATQ